MTRKVLNLVTHVAVPRLASMFMVSEKTLKRDKEKERRKQNKKSWICKKCPFWTDRI